MRIQTYCVIIFAVIICTFDFIDASYKNEQEQAVNGKVKSSQAKKSLSRFKGVFFLAGLLGVMFGGIFIYYLFLCHPILCRKERNYDVVEQSRDSTPVRNICPEKSP